MPMSQMQTYADFERQQQTFMDQMKKHDMECISCPKCQCQFFEQLEVMKYKADHNVILGQDVPPKPGSQPYKFLKCIKCNELLEPRILHNTRDVIGGDYEELLDILEGKNEKEPEKVAENKNEIQAEKL